MPGNRVLSGFARRLRDVLVILPCIAWRNVGFGNSTNFDLIDVIAPGLIGYNLTTSIGPVGLSGPYSNAQFINVAMTGGALTFSTVTDYSVQATVQVVPEPGSLVLTAAGLGMLVFTQRRRRLRHG